MRHIRVLQTTFTDFFLLKLKMWLDPQYISHSTTTDFSSKDMGKDYTE
jgi:hypothetical protein